MERRHSVRLDWVCATSSFSFKEMDELRVVLLGKTGTGKSSLGNTLLGRRVFDPESGLSSGTKRCQWAEGVVSGVKLSVTDTPGLCDTHRSEDEVLLEVGKSVAVACPGPHVVIIVIRCDRRFTKEEYDAVKTLLALFGDCVRNHLMIVFTGGDDLKVPIGGMQEALDQQLKKAPEDLKVVLCDAYNRYCVVNNAGSPEEKKHYANLVLVKIKDLVRRNSNAYFHDKMVNEYNQRVQSLIARRQRTHRLPQDEAVRETRKAIVDEKEDSGFFSSLKNIAKTYILPVLPKVGEFALNVAAGLVVKRCSVM